jgi:hypothetical protein
MLSEWSAECSADDPVLVVPWSDPAHPDRRFIDLRENPYDLDHIPEAEHYPALMHALRALNASRSPVFTAKSDAWPLDHGVDHDELNTLRITLSAEPEEAVAGFASYIDLLWRERSLFASFHLQEQLLRRLTRHAESLDHPYAMLDCIIRPAMVDLTGPHQGFAVSLYIKALGRDVATAEQNWAAALGSVVSIMRSKELAFT